MVLLGTILEYVLEYHVSMVATTGRMLPVCPYYRRYAHSMVVHMPIIYYLLVWYVLEYHWYHGTVVFEIMLYLFVVLEYGHTMVLASTRTLAILQ
jgi:hypothetical protein